MGKLIHSKLFRQNLLKWIFTYLVVLMATTSVITYSRYISNMQGESSARTAKFNVEISEVGVCVAGTEICDLQKYKPYDKLDYIFTVDTRDIEVSTLILTNIIVSSTSPFTIDKLFVDDVEVNLSTSPYSIDGKIISVNETIEPNQGYLREYKLRISYDEDSASSTAVYENAVSAGYSATQLD